MADHPAAATSPRVSSARRTQAAPGYTRTAIALHWLVALFILGSFVVGTYMVDLDLSPWKLKVYSWHKWDGVTIFLLVVARFAWRLFHSVPPLPATMRPWEHNVAGVAHALLYLLMLAVPISGWLMSSAAGIPVVYFGVLQLPDLVAKNKELLELLKIVHYVLNKALLALIVLHVAAAVKHHVVDRDDVLVRMLPLLARRQKVLNNDVNAIRFYVANLASGYIMKREESLECIVIEFSAPSIERVVQVYTRAKGFEMEVTYESLYGDEGRL